MAVEDEQQVESANARIVEHSQRQSAAYLYHLSAAAKDQFDDDK